MSSGYHRLNTGQQDAVRTVGMLLGYLVTGLIPRSLDHWLLKLSTRVFLRVRHHSAGRFAERMATALDGAASPEALLASARDHYALLFERMWGRTRSLHRRGWIPEIRIDGLQELRESQERGRGTILWRMSFCSTTVVKIALWQAGIRLVHLSREQHGASSDAWIARKVLCPLYRRTENWYLSERVVMSRGGSPLAAKQRLLRCLEEDNAVVSIFGDNPGRRGVITPFLTGHANLAAGAPSLAEKVGSTLLPVFVVWEAVGRYRVVIDRPIELDPAVDRDEKICLAVAEYAARMEEAVRSYPGSWIGWDRFLSRTAPYLDAPDAPPA